MMIKTLYFIPLVLSVLILTSNTSTANPLLNGINRPIGGSGIESRFNTSPAAPSITLREAVSIAEQRYEGRAVGARAITTPSGPAYRVRILQDNGKIKNVIIDG